MIARPVNGAYLFISRNQVQGKKPEGMPPQKAQMRQSFFLAL